MLSVMARDELADMDMAKRVAETLHKHYPNHLWAVTVQEGSVIVKNLAISDKWCYHIRVRDLYGDPSLKTVIRGGGELLERAKIARGEWKGDVAQSLDGADKHFHPIIGVANG